MDISFFEWKEFTQYTSVAFGKRCAKLSVRPLMGSVGDAYDNAMAERFFASFEYSGVQFRDGIEVQQRVRRAMLGSCV